MAAPRNPRPYCDESDDPGDDLFLKLLDADGEMQWEFMELDVFAKYTAIIDAEEVKQQLMDQGEDYLDFHIPNLSTLTPKRQHAMTILSWISGRGCSPNTPIRPIVAADNAYTVSALMHMASYASAIGLKPQWVLEDLYHATTRKLLDVIDDGDDTGAMFDELFGLFPREHPLIRRLMWHITSKASSYVETIRDASQSCPQFNEALGEVLTQMRRSGLR